MNRTLKHVEHFHHATFPCASFKFDFSWYAHDVKKEKQLKFEGYESMRFAFSAHQFYMGSLIN